MPIFDYRCDDCGHSYDVFHKVKELQEDIVCPSCGSKKYKKMMSRVSVSVSGGTPKSSSSIDDISGSSCDSCCNNGMCGMN